MATAITPPRTDDQRHLALAKANHVRSTRAAYKTALRTARDPWVMAEGILRDPPAELRTMKVLEFMVAVRMIGPVKSRQILAISMVSPAKTLGGLTERQRGVVADWFKSRSDRSSGGQS